MAILALRQQIGLATGDNGKEKIAKNEP